MKKEKFDNIEKSMGDYHSLLWNLVVLVRYMQVEHKKCAGAKALVPIGRSIQLDPDCSTCGGCTFNTPPQQPLVPPAQYPDEPSLKLPCKLPQRCVPWSFRASSPRATSLRAPPAMRILELPQRCIAWSFRASFPDDVDPGGLGHTPMRRLQKRTNRRPWLQVWRKADL